MKYILSFIVAVFLYSCNSNEISNRNILFDKYEGLGKNSQKSDVLKIDSLFFYNGKPFYRFEFNCWQGVIMNERYFGIVPSLKGFISIESNKVYFKPINIQSDTNSFLLFDFDMSIGDKFQYKDSDYSIKLEDKLMKQDSIFKFRYQSSKIRVNGLDLVCYVEKRKGVIGMYLGSYNDSVKVDEVYSSIGQIYDIQKLKKINHVIK